MTHDDPTRPDLDAAIDAVVPSLTAISDDAAADSLRRTRVALAEAGEGGRSPVRAVRWRWAVPTAACAVALAVALLSWLGGPPPVDPLLIARPTVATAPAPRAMTGVLVSGRAVANGRANAGRVDRTALSPPTAAAPLGTAGAPRPDPLTDLMRAADTISEEAWTAGLDSGRAPIVLSDVALTPIAVGPLETPPIFAAPAEPAAPGGP